MNIRYYKNLQILCIMNKRQQILREGFQLFKLRSQTKKEIVLVKKPECAIVLYNPKK